VSGLNARSTSKQIWAIIRKINGKTTDPLIKQLNINNNFTTSPTDISNALAGSFASNSSSDHYTAAFQTHKNRTELENLNFHTSINSDYNKEFSLRELHQALKISKSASVGPDNIHYELLRNLPITSKLVLLSLFNHIWLSGYFPPSWRKAIIIPISKPGKDSANPNNYGPIVLTICQCKTMERMVNNHLTWFLEYNNHLNI